MKIIAYTDNPDLLLKIINEKIQKKELKTWEIIKSNDGNIYNHIPSQWSEKALIKPSSYLIKNETHFDIVWWESEEEPEESLKGYIIGRFTEILMVHFREYFDELKIE